MTDHQKTKIAEMRKAGCGYSEISKALSVSRDTVKTFCRRNNITVDSTEEPKEAAGICPECGSQNVNFGDVEFKDGENYQDCGCQDCGCLWNEYYTFSKKELVKE